MKAFVVCALLATFAAVSFAHHLELCKKQDDQLRTELQCIGLHISAEANQSFNKALKTLGCKDWSCVIRKLCVGNDLEAAMANHFTRYCDVSVKEPVLRAEVEDLGCNKSQISEIHSASTVCDPEAGHHHHHH